MKLDIENKLTELALNFQHSINASLKRRGIRMVKLTRMEFQDAENGCPSFVFFNIEGWNTHKLMITEDGRLIRESMELNHETGINIKTKIKSIVDEMVAFDKHCRLYDSLKANEVVFRGYKVKVIGSNQFGREAVYEITLRNGVITKWFGRSAEDALTNGAPWIKERVKSVKRIEGAK